MLGLTRLFAEAKHLIPQRVTDAAHGQAEEEVKRAGFLHLEITVARQDAIRSGGGNCCVQMLAMKSYRQNRQYETPYEMRKNAAKVRYSEESTKGGRSARGRN